MEERTVRFDQDLQIEAYQFKGIRQKFPNHFHEFYVLGFIEKGRRSLTCKQKNYLVDEGDLLLINPYDSHLCEQLGNDALDYRSIHIRSEVMEGLARDITGQDGLPVFSHNVVPKYPELDLLKELHELMSQGGDPLRKAECLCLFLEGVLCDFSSYEVDSESTVSRSIDLICSYIQTYYDQQLTLDRLGELAHLNQYTLIRQFTKLKGITPHQYLTTIRIGEAKKMLEQGVSPLDTAVSTGFSDQSHFTRSFKNLIGVTPKQYRDSFKKERSNEGTTSKVQKESRA